MAKPIFLHTSATMTQSTENPDRYNVRAGKREIGFIVLFRDTWRFLNKLGDPRFPSPALEHATPEAALAYVNRTLAS